VFVDVDSVNKCIEILKKVIKSDELNRISSVCSTNEKTSTVHIFAQAYEHVYITFFRVFNCSRECFVPSVLIEIS